MKATKHENYCRNLYGKFYGSPGSENESLKMEQVMHEEIQEHQVRFGISRFAAVLLVALEIKYLITQDVEVLNFISLFEILEITGRKPLIDGAIMAAAKELETQELIVIENLQSKTMQRIAAIDRNVYDYFGMEEVKPELEISNILVSLTQKLINNLTN